MTQPTRAAASAGGGLMPLVPAQRGAMDAALGSPAGAPSGGLRPGSIVICNWRDLTHPEGGGSELYVENLARGLAASGHTVTLLCARVAGQPANEVKSGVRYRRRGGRFTVYLHAALALLLGWVRHDVVIDVQNGLPWLSRLVTRKPVIVLMHHVHREQWPIAVGKLQGQLGWWAESRFGVWLYRRSSYVAVSEATRRELIGLGVAPERVRVIHNGTPALSRPRIPRDGSPRIAVLGRLVPHKRVEVTIRAVAALRSHLPDLRLDVIGDGYWRAELEAEVARLGVGPAVEFHGRVSQQRKSDLLAAAWLHAVASVKEGWALTVMEAASVATPTVAFAGAGGLDESVVDGVTGVLVHGGEPEFIAALGELLADPAAREALGRAAAGHAERFTWQHTTHRWAELLAPLLATTDTPAGARTGEAVTTTAR